MLYSHYEAIDNIDKGILMTFNEKFYNRIIQYL